MEMAVVFAIHSATSAGSSLAREDLSTREKGKRAGEEKYVDAMKVAQHTFDADMVSGNA
jgi:hypothetical protein